jgi:hypothetical protein
MLTTTDNPWDPYTHWDAWSQWDHDHGYNTAEYLARIANVPEDADDETANELIDQAQQEIIKANVLGIYEIV